MDFKVDLADKEKCLIMSVLAKVKTILEIAKMFSKYHWAVK